MQNAHIGLSWKENRSRSGDFALPACTRSVRFVAGWARRMEVCRDYKFGNTVCPWWMKRFLSCCVVCRYSERRFPPGWPQNGIREAGYRSLWPVTLSWSACNGSVAPQFSGCGPVFFFDVVHDDIDGARVAFQCFAGRFRDGFGQFPFLLYRTAFKKLYVDCWHDFS